jgi:hypothetical protein
MRRRDVNPRVGNHCLVVAPHLCYREFRRENATRGEEKKVATDTLRTTPAAFLDALEALDLDTADQVAELLRAKKITGRRHQPEACPIARYLIREGFGAVTVGTTDASAVNPGTTFFMTEALPPAAQDFISEFDGPHHAYPDLEQPS